MAVGTSDVPVRVERLGSGKKNPNGQWWSLKDADLHAGVTSVVADLDGVDTRRINDNLKWARLYGNREILGTRPGQTRRTVVEPGKPTGFTFNVIRSCVDTAVAKIGQNRPKPMFLTEDADVSLQGRAKRLSKYIEGVFYDGQAYEVAQKAFRDSTVFGTGIVHLFWDEDSKGRARLRFERVLPDELLVDEEEGRYGEPSQLHRRKWILRDRLVELFPKSEREISAAKGTQTDTTSPRAVDHIEVIESWHLPSAPGAGDGRHAICIDGATLFSEKWEYDFFPFVFFHWSEPIIGFWGTGLAEELVGIQIEINRLCRDISAAQRMMSRPRVFVEAGTQIVPAHLNPGLGDAVPVVKYVGRPPTFQTPPAMPGEIYADLDRWIRRAYEVTGVSQLSASGRKPAGLDSGAALREYNDQVSERFITTSQRWEEFFMQLSRKAVALSRARYEAGDRNLAIVAAQDKFVKTIKWKDVDLEADKYLMKVFPTNLLPSTPAGRMQQVVELLQADLLPKELALSLLDFPDVEHFVSLETAALEDIRYTIETILEEGKPGTVDELTNLALAQQLGMSAVLRAKRMNYPERNIELLRRWVDAVTDAMTPPAAPALPEAELQPQPASDVAGALPAQPGPVPTNELMPVSDPTAKADIQPMMAQSPFASFGNYSTAASDAGIEMPGWAQTASKMASAGGTQKGGVDTSKMAMAMAPMIAKAVSDPVSKEKLRELEAAPPAEMMKSLEGGITFHYKPGVPGEDPAEKKFGTTTTHLKTTEMGATMVDIDPQTGLEVIKIKDAIGPILASLSNLDARFRVLEEKLGIASPAESETELSEPEGIGSTDDESI